MDTLLKIIVIIISVALFAALIWGIIKYIKACNYYYYKPVCNDCFFVLASIALPLGMVMFSNAFSEASVSNVVIFTAFMNIAAAVACIVLIAYTIKRIYSKTGSYKFAVASYFVEAFIVYFGLMSAGLVVLAAFVVTKKIGED